MFGKFLKSTKSFLAVGLFGLSAVVVPTAHADPTYTATFQGLTFTFVQTDANTLSFNIAGTIDPLSDWASAQYLGAFDLKDLGLDFSSVTAVANGPGASNLAGLNSQVSAANIDCSSGGSPPGSICFDLAPDVALGSMPINMTYIIDFSSNLNIAAAGPHLQLVFTATEGGDKVGSLYSQNVPSSSGSSSGSSGQVSEPNSGLLALLGVFMLASVMWMRRRSIG